MAVDIDWAPFEFVDKNKHYRGMAADYIRLVEERLGIAIEIDKERPWPKMVEAVKNRDLDAFSLVVRTPQRDEFANFTRPYISFPMIIVTLDSEAYIDGIEALRKHEIAVVKSYASHELLQKNHPELKLHLADNVRKGLEAVSNGQAYAFIGNLAVVSQVIREAGITNLKVSGQTPYRFDLSMAVRKDWPELVPILQKALDSISFEERDQIYNQWIRLKFEEKIDYRIILVVIVSGLLVLTIILGWNRKLKREIVHRQMAEKAMKENQELFSKAFHLSPVALSFSNPDDGSYHDVNDAWITTFGYSHAEAIANSALKLGFWVNPDNRLDFLDRLKNNDLPTNGFETKIRAKNGKEFNVIAYGEFVEINSEVMLFMVFHDITERKKTERALGESHERFQTLIETMNVVPWEFDIASMRFTYVGPQAIALFGYPLEQWYTEGFWEKMIHPDDREYATNFCMSATAECKDHDFEYRALMADGSVTWVRDVVTVAAENGVAKGLHGVLIDISGRKNAEEELIQHRDRLQELVDTATKELTAKATELELALAKEQELNKLQREFVSMASHEFRTPLAIIDSTAQRMRSRADKGRLTPEDAVQRVEKIRAAVKRMTRLMESTLDAARMEEGKIKIAIKPCNIGKVVQDVCTYQQEIAQSHVISYEEVDLPETIQADTGSLEQAFTNLLSNAVKYAPDAPDIRVVARTEGDQVVISVRDHGIGIDGDELDRIGERFFRARTSTGTAGTGIGLNLAKTLVEMHGGTIYMQSQKGQGSTFTIRLPIAGPDQLEQADSLVA